MNILNSFLPHFNSSMVLYLSHVQLLNGILFTYLRMQVPPCFGAITTVQSPVSPGARSTGAVPNPGKPQAYAGPSTVTLAQIGPQTNVPITFNTYTSHLAITSLHSCHFQTKEDSPQSFGFIYESTLLTK